MFLTWVADNVLALTTVGLAAVTVGATWWTTRHDTRERQRERLYSRTLHLQAALRTSSTLAAELHDSRSLMANAVPTLVALLVGLGTISRRWDFGKGAELVTHLATSVAVPRESSPEGRQYAFLRSTYEVAGLLTQLGPLMDPQVIDHLRQRTVELQATRVSLPWRRPKAVEDYITAVNAAHIELENIIRSQRLEPPAPKVGPLKRRRKRRRQSTS